MSALGGWRLSAHAAAVMLRRRFDPADVEQAIEQPWLSYPQRSYGEGRELRRRGKVAVVVHVPSRTVVTVLLGSTGLWTDADCPAA